MPENKKLYSPVSTLAQSQVILANTKFSSETMKSNVAMMKSRQTGLCSPMVTMWLPSVWKLDTYICSAERSLSWLKLNSAFLVRIRHKELEASRNPTLTQLAPPLQTKLPTSMWTVSASPTCLYIFCCLISLGHQVLGQGHGWHHQSWQLHPSMHWGKTHTQVPWCGYTESRATLLRLDGYQT